MAAAYNGHLQVLQWVKEEFKLTVKDAGAHDNDAFRSAAENGHLHVVQWLNEELR